MCFFIIVNIICYVCTCSADTSTVPVFLMDYESVMTNLKIETNPFTILGSTNFANIIHEAIKQSEIVIIFAEETFSMEDVSVKDKMGSPYYHLRQGLIDRKVKFLPSVQEPYKILNQIFQPQQYNTFYLSSTSSKIKSFEAHFSYYYIHFEDGLNETRSTALRRHDLIMREVYYVLRQFSHGPVVAFYTGKTNPIVIEKLEFVSFPPTQPKKDTGVMIVTDGALFKFYGVFGRSGLRRATLDQTPLLAEQTWTRRKMSTKMAYTDFELQFNFTYKTDGWLLDSVALLEGEEEVGRTEMGIGAPWRRSYICAEPLVLVNNRDASSVTITRYQIQPLGERRVALSQDEPPADGAPAAPPAPPAPSGNGTQEGFGKPVNCAPYFTQAILGALFVSGVCLCILGYGLLCLLSINTNSNFDDPHSKPLVIHTVGD